MQTGRCIGLLRMSGPSRLALGYVIAMAILLLAALSSAAPVAAAPPGSAADGETIFKAQCTACHTIGQGVLVGPDLQGVTQRRDAVWLTDWISAPDKMIANGDPIATQLLAEHNNVAMPNLGLGADQVASLIAYLATTGAPPPSVAPPSVAPAAPLPAGDAARGRSLYTGSTRFANGGPPCLGCHTIAGIGALGGGALGPDHTTSYQRLGDAVITFPQTGTMLPIFGTKPLTPQEQADLLAFFRAAPVGERPVQLIWELAGLAALGTSLLAAFAALVWRRRLRSVRARTVRGAYLRPRQSTRTEG